MKNSYSDLYAEARSALLQTPFGEHPGLFFHPSIEGYRDYVFGMRAGPSSELDGLAHELAHAVEFGAASFRYRCLHGRFIFKVPKFHSAYICGQTHTWHDDPLTMQSTMRELRTFAIQTHIREMMGVPVNQDGIWYWAGAMQYMHDWFHVPGEKDRDRREFCAEMIELLYFDFDKEDILKELKGWLDAVCRRKFPITDQHLTVFTGYRE